MYFNNRFVYRFMRKVGRFYLDVVDSIHICDRMTFIIYKMSMHQYKTNIKWYKTELLAYASKNYFSQHYFHVIKSIQARRYIRISRPEKLAPIRLWFNATPIARFCRLGAVGRWLVKGCRYRHYLWTYPPTGLCLVVDDSRRLVLGIH